MALLRLGNAVMHATARPRRAGAALDFDDLIARAASLLAVVGGGRMGALQARRRPRPHPGRRGAGHEPRAVAGDPRAGRGVLRRQRRARGARARCSRSATRSSRSTASRARRPTMFAEIGERSRAARRARRPAVAARAAHPVVPLGRRRCWQAVDRRLRRSRARRRALTARPSRSRTSRIAPGTPGLVEIWPTEKPRGRRAAPSPGRRSTRAAAPRRWCGWRRASPTPSTAGSSRGEMLASEDRPIRAGDILILVRKRAPFAPAMCRR